MNSSNRVNQLCFLAESAESCSKRLLSHAPQELRIRARGKFLSTQYSNTLQHVARQTLDNCHVHSRTARARLQQPETPSCCKRASMTGTRPSRLALQADSSTRVHLYIFVADKRPRPVHTLDLVKPRDMKLRSHHLAMVGGGAYVGTIMHVYP